MSVSERFFFLRNNATTLTFVSDNTVPSVGISTMLDAQMRTPSNLFFRAGDSIFIESIYIRTDFNFCLAEQDFQAQFRWELSDLSASQTIQEFGPSGILNVPSLNEEHQISIQIPAPDDAGTPKNWGIKLIFAEAQFSQLNVPDLINGDTINVTVYFKLRNTLSMLVAP